MFLTQLFYLAQYSQVVQGRSAILSGALLIPLGVVQTAASTGSGYYLSWSGNYRIALLFGWAVWSVAMGICSTLEVDTGLPKLVGFTILAGLGLGCTLSP